MAYRSIFQHISFFTLSKKQQDDVSAYAQSRQFSLDGIYEIFQNQKELTVSLAYWDTKLDVLNQFTSCSFGAMIEADLIMLQQELYFALYISVARYKLELAEGLGDVLGDHGKKITQCNDLLNAVNKALKPETILADFPPLPMVTDDQVKWGLDWIDVFNERRLYWVWAGRGGLLGATIDLLPDNNVYHKAQALGALDVLVPFTGTLSWALYYFRCSVRLGILFKHTIPGPWMSKEVADTIPLRERFSVHLNKCKFYLMNDFFWADCNLACYFWLCGNAVADYYGGALTAALLLMDVSISIWAYAEDYAQYDKDMKRLNADMLMLNNTQVYKLNALKHAQRQCKLDWDYKLYGLYVDMLYAISLFVAFSFLYSFFLPIAAVPASTALTLAVTGTVMCFTLNAIGAALKQALEVCKSIELSNYAAKDVDNADKCVPGAQKSDFELKLLKSEWIYHQTIIEFKQASLLRGVLIDFLVPPVVFVALVFMPLNMGLAVIAVGLALAVKFYSYIEGYEPDIKDLPKFNPDPVNVITPNIIHGFFGTATTHLHDQREMVLKCA